MSTRIRLWSGTPASNSSTPPYGAPEGGTNVNQLSDLFRQIMADVRLWFETPEWRDLGHTTVYASASSFTISGNVASSYVVGQRIKLTDSSTLYGTISASSYSVPNTTVTVTLDSGSLSSSLSSVALGTNPSNKPIATTALSGLIQSTNIPTSSIIPTGSCIPFMGSTAPTGWVLANGTIGNGSSGATRRANADTETLFTLLWNDFSNTEAPVSTGRGASAAADFAANKTITIPDTMGRVIAGKEATASRLTSAGSGVDGATLGASGGSQFMQQHNHSVTDPGHLHGISNMNATLPRTGGGSGNVYDTGAATKNTNSATTGITIDNAGTGTSQNVQPTLVLNMIVKL